MKKVKRFLGRLFYRPARPFAIIFGLTLLISILGWLIPIPIDAVPKMVIGIALVVEVLIISVIMIKFLDPQNKISQKLQDPPYGLIATARDKSILGLMLFFSLVILTIFTLQFMDGILYDEPLLIYCILGINGFLWIIAAYPLTKVTWNFY